MFNFENWLKQSYINLVLNGTWSASYCADRCAAQLDNGRFNDSDVEEIYWAVEGYAQAESEMESESEVASPEELEDVSGSIINDLGETTDAEIIE